MNNVLDPSKEILKHQGVLIADSNPVEIAKDKGNYLRGTLVETFADQITGSIPAKDTYLIKFHGTYQQDDRDQRIIRQEKKLEPAYSFMIRVRIPGGDLTSQAWLALDAISDEYGNHDFKLTTRQAVQFHGIIKFDLKQTIKAMDKALLDSIAGCGDVNRNVMCAPDPTQSEIHAQVYPWAKKISEHLLPKSRAYHEIWLDEGSIDGKGERKGEGKKLVNAPEQEETVEPLYGKLYLPKKFKIGIAIPPNNDSDIYTNDVGIVAIVKDDVLQGFNIATGGGMAMSFGRKETYPRLATDIAYVKPEQLLEVVTTIVEIQRDYGDRTDRSQARLKYTIDRMGLDTFKTMLVDRLGYEMETPRAVKFETSADNFGWHQATNGKWHLLCFVEHGRVQNVEGSQQKQALKEIAELDVCKFRLTGNQHLLLVDIDKNDKSKIEAIFKQHGLSADAIHLSGLRRNAIACVALNTCPLAMAEAERYLPSLITKIEPILKKNGLFNDEIKFRMTGCPNGCGRSVMGEIGFIGKSLGRYNVYLGSSHQGDRLSKLYKENLDEKHILEEMDLLFTDYANNRNPHERFGDYVIRAEYVEATKEGKFFHN